MHRPYGPGHGGGHHHHGAPHGHSSSGMQLTMRVTKQVQAAHRKFAMQAAARSMAAGARFARVITLKGRRRAQAAQQQLRAPVVSNTYGLHVLRVALGTVVKQPMDCQPIFYGNSGAALFFRHNWIPRDCTPQVVFACNTVQPASGNPVAALCWEPAGITSVDLQRESLRDAAKRGRLFVFRSNIRFATGESYAIRPATFINDENGPPGLWSFATAGLFKDQVFFIGHASLGTFENPELECMLVARPFQWSDEKSMWSWAGRSSAECNGKRTLLVESLFDSEPDARVDFQLPSMSPGSDIVSVPCRARDVHGDPIGVVDTTERVAFRVQRIGQRLHLMARPNQRDAKGRVFFAGYVTANQNGQFRFEVPFEENGEEVTIALPSNYRDARGTPWFVRYANAKERLTGLPLVLVPLGQS